MVHQPRVKKWIYGYLNSQQNWFNSSDVQNFIKSKLRIKIPTRQIVESLKIYHNLSLKRGNPRSVDLDSERINFLKKLFCAKIAKQLSIIKILIRKDETSINNDTTQAMSWLKRGKSWSVWNIKFKKSINLISAVWSDDTAINLLKYTKTNKDSIIAFLKFLFKFVDETKDLLPYEIRIVWDNCSPHRAKEVKRFWIERRAWLFYLLSTLLSSPLLWFIFQS